MTMFSCTPCCGPVSVGWCLHGWGKSLAHYNFEGYFQTFARSTSWTAAPLAFSTRYGASQTYYELGLNGYWMRMDVTVDFTKRAQGKVSVTVNLRWKGPAGEAGILVVYERSTSHWDNFDIPGRYSFERQHAISWQTSGQTSVYPPQAADIGSIGFIVGYTPTTLTGKSLLVNQKASIQQVRIDSGSYPAVSCTWAGMQAQTWQLDNLTTSGQKLCDVQKGQPWCVRSIERISSTLRGYGAMLEDGADPCAYAHLNCYKYTNQGNLWSEAYIADTAFQYLSVGGELDTGWLPSRLGPRPYPGFSAVENPGKPAVTHGEFRMTYKLV